MPSCGLFDSFSTLKNTLPVAQGVCDDLNSICTNMAEFTTSCLLLESVDEYVDCASLKIKSTSCDNDSLNYFLMGHDGANLCGLTNIQVALIQIFTSNCIPILHF